MPRNNLHVLLVEDDKVDQLAFKRLVKNNQFSITYSIADSVARATQSIRASKYDIIISDYSLGDGTAFEILELAGDTPVIIATGAGDEEIAVKALKAGAHDYLIKDPERNYLKILPLTVENAIQKRRTDGQIRMLSHAMMNINEGVVITDLKENIRFVNDAFLKTYGYQESEIVGQPICVLYSSNNPEAVLKEILPSTLRGGWQGELINKRKDGSEFPVFLSNSIIPRKDKEPIALAGVVQDITENKRAQKALQESEERYRTLIEDSPLAILVHSDGKIVYINPAAVKLIGATSEKELLGRPVMELVHPDYHNIVRERIQKIYEQKEEASPIEEKFIRLDGQVIDVEVTGKIVEFRGQPASQVIINDITERKRAREALQESEERFRRFFEDLGDAVFVTKISGSDKGRILEVNYAAEQQTGYSRDELIGMNIATDIAVRNQAGIDFEEWDNKLLQGEKVTAVEMKKRKDGSEYWTEVVVTPIDYKGEKAGLSINHDITERRRLEEQLRQAQKMEAVGQLAGGVAHDFNNLLTVINGYCDLLLSRDLPEKMQGPMEQIQKAGKRATRLTSQLLAFSRKQIIQPKIINLNKLIFDQNKMLGRLLREDIEIDLQLYPEIGMVKVDPGQIEQVIINIAVNAGDAMPTGGKLTIETANVKFKEDYVKNHAGAQSGHYVMLAISDTGVGMDETTCSRIFEPFFSTKGREKGTGLGLATVYGIVKQNQGLIYVYSELQKGTTFKIYLPQVEEKTKNAETSPANQPDLHGSETILLVEDDPGVLELTRSTLADYGYTVLTGENGEEALRIYREYQGNIELLITDIIMPELGGKELADKLLPENPELKVLYFSGYTNNAIAHYGILDDGVEYIQKPYSHIELAKRIRQVLDK